jgi:glycogen(starch) synthase
MTRVLHLVPRLPPSPDGVGGYAQALAGGLAERGVVSSFLATAPDGHGAHESTGAAARGGPEDPGVGPGEILVERSAAALAERLAASGAGIVWVHYVNYAYQRRGCPAWLVDGVARWRAAVPGRRLVTYFHEVYASGPPWRSSFWLGPLQRRLAARLLAASDGAATSLALYRRLLERLRRPMRWAASPAAPGRREPAARPPILVLPVLSTLGEPATVPVFAAREPRTLVVFGGAGNRARAWGAGRDALGAACRALAIDKILDLGPPLPPGELPAWLGGVPVLALGALPPAQASAALLTCCAGFLAYPPPLLAKSTVYAAYCAHGLLPVCTWPGRAAGDPRERPPCWDPAAAPLLSDTAGRTDPGAAADPAGHADAAALAALASHALAWYRGHDLAHQSAAFHALLEETTVSGAGATAAHRTAAAPSARRLRILIYSPAFLPSVGGLEIGQALLADRFTRLGHEVTVVTRTAADPGDPSQPGLAFRVVRQPGPLELLAAVRWCDVFFQANVSLRGLWPLLLVPRPWAVSHHSWYCRTDGRIAWQDRLKRRLLRYAAASISVSHAIAADLGTPSTVIPNCYRDDLFRLLPAVERSRDLLFLGRLVSDKGVDLLIAALGRLAAAGLRPGLTLVGDGPELPELWSQAYRLGVAEQIDFTGMRTGEELVRLLNRHRILVVPSRYDEPFGVVALEGIACGCAVVGSSGGGLPEAIGPCGRTFRNGSVEGLTDVLAELLRSPESFDQLRAGAAAHLAHHRSDPVARRYLEALAAGISRPARR